MPIVVRCSECGALLKFRDEALGKRAKCTKCRAVVQVLPKGDSHQGHENDDAGILDNRADATATAASQSKRRAVRPTFQPASVATTRSPAVKDRADERVLVGANLRVRMAVLIVML